MSSKMAARRISCLLLCTIAVLGHTPEASHRIKYGSANEHVADEGSEALLQKPQRHSLTQAPQNHAVLVGETVVLECSVADPPPYSRVMWGEFITNVGGSIISDNEVILSHPNQDRYRIIQTSSTEFYLEIRDVVLQDGGKYVCQDTLSGPPDSFRGEAELIVIASNPNCTTTAPSDGRLNEGQTYTAECIVYYQGLYAPTMTWTGPPPFQVGQSPPNPAGVWSGIQYVADRSMDQGIYECLTNFTDIGSVPTDVANNTPTWSFLYQDPRISISWGPRNIYAVPIREEYAVGDTITCYADAHPSPHYHWLNQRNFDLVYSQTFTVTESMAGFNQTLRCQAQNIIDGFVFIANVFVPVNVPAPTSPPTSPSTAPTTTQPASSPCEDLTGQWRSDDPYAEMILEVIHDSEIGEIRGIMKNLTDTVWVEVIGSVRRGDYLYVGLTAIWPFQDGITGIAGECHRCQGVEVMMTDSLWRAVAQSSACGQGSTPAPDVAYRFHRLASTTSVLQQKEFDVYNPTEEVSGRLGIKLRKR